MQLCFIRVLSVGKERSQGIASHKESLHLLSLRKKILSSSSEKYLFTHFQSLTSRCFRKGNRQSWYSSAKKNIGKFQISSPLIEWKNMLHDLPSSFSHVLLNVVPHLSIIVDASSRHTYNMLFIKGGRSRRDAIDQVSHHSQPNKWWIKVVGDNDLTIRLPHNFLVSKLKHDPSSKAKALPLMAWWQKKKPWTKIDGALSSCKRWRPRAPHIELNLYSKLKKKESREEVTISHIIGITIRRSIKDALFHSCHSHFR